MERLKPSLKKRKHLAQVMTLIGILMFLQSGCKSPTSPDGKGEADIIVYSLFEEILDVYMDGTFRFSIGYQNPIEIDNVSFGTHEIEAKKSGSDIVFASTTIEVTEKIDYTWQIEDPADINVVNSYGEALKIYMDEAYQFDLANEEGRWILDVPLGEHFLKALKVSDSMQVASILLDISENKDYVWTIKKLN